MNKELTDRLINDSKYFKNIFNNEDIKLEDIKNKISR